MSLDAVVVGSGPNGLAGAITLARAGLKVRVYEAAPTVGGGLRSAALTRPGFVHDVCSTAHPLAQASPFMATIDWTRHGVVFDHPPLPFAHPLGGGDAALAHRDLDATAEGLGPDGPAYRRLLAPLVRDVDGLVAELLGELRPPFGHLATLARFGVRAAVPATVLARSFRGRAAPALLAGSAAHSEMRLSSPAATPVGLLLMTLAHTYGWPVARGGSQAIADALAAELAGLGGEVVTGHRVADLRELPAAAIRLLDISPRALLALAGPDLPSGYAAQVRRFRYGPGVCKVDWALSGPVPWSAAGARRAGTLHLGGSWQETAAAEAEVAAGGHARRPFVLAVQATTADPTRAPRGGHTLWAYAHVPNGSTLDVADTIQAQVERFAPGFGATVLDRTVMTAAEEAAHDENWVGGDIATGASTVRQLLFRPVVRWSARTVPLPGTFLCSSATAPGGGVHGMCGHLAALRALSARVS